jgi:hypothetical protein
MSSHVVVDDDDASLKPMNKKRVRDLDQALSDSDSEVPVPQKKPKPKKSFPATFAQTKVFFFFCFDFIYKQNVCRIVRLVRYCFSVTNYLKIIEDDTRQLEIKYVLIIHCFVFVQNLV